MSAVKKALQRRPSSRAAPAQGAVIAARVPRGRSKIHVEEGAHECKIESRTYKILCVDDDVECAALLRECLVDKGFEVLLAHDALQGLTSVLRDRPDLVLSDVRMPGMSGVEMWRLLRETSPKAQVVPFIFLTGSSKRESDMAGGPTGGAAFFAKPIDFDTLLRAVEERLLRTPSASVPDRELTDREIEALLWAARGKSRRQIAEIMGITLRTVMFHLTRARKRLEASTFSEAVVKAALRGVIRP